MSEPRRGAVVYPFISKDDATCCRKRALADGRPVIGFCSPECIRRPYRQPDRPPAA